MLHWNVESAHSKLHFLAYYNAENKLAVLKHTEKLTVPFAEAGLPTAIEAVETSVYMSSYSRSIVQYADIEDVEVIVLVIHDYPNMKHFDAVDKENILLNRFGKPVLCL